MSNYNTKKVNFNPNVVSHQGYAEKQLLPQSLLKELIDEDNEMKMNMNYLDTQMTNIKLNDRNQLPFHMTQPKRKVYSHQNVIEFNNPNIYNNFPMNPQPNVFHQNFMYNNFHNRQSYLMENFSNERFNDMMGYSNFPLTRSIF